MKRTYAPNSKKFSGNDLVKGLKVILKNGLHYKKELFLTLILSLVYAAIDPFDTIILGRFIDALTHTTIFEFWGTPVPLYIILIVAWIVVQTTEIILERYRVLASLKLNEFSRRFYLVRVLGHIFRLPVSYHKATKMGEVQERIASAASAIGSILGEDLMLFAPQFLSSLIFLFVLFHLNFNLFLFTLISITLFIYATILTVRPTVPLQRQSIRAYGKITGIATDAITNIRIVKDFGAEKYQTDIIEKGYIEDAIPVWYKLMGLRRRQSLVQKLIIMCSRGMVLIFSIYLVREGLWTIGSLVIANGYLNQIFSPITRISDNWRNIQNGIIAIEEAEAILEIPTEKYLEEKGEMETLQGKVTFENVSFGYTAGNTVLKNISFTANPGDIIALVGESGVGKSSLVDLISAHYLAEQGRILIDGRPIQEIQLRTLRHNIGVVTQELTLFNDTIKNNLRYGNFDKSDQEIFVAAKKAHCYDFIEKFPEKWDQMVGERGLKLSVGQKQRVAIARAILKNPRILVLDEPTSALDAGSEKIITESLDELMQGKTTFVVAHRLSTVRRAHTILVFKEGTIVESGTHDELLAIKGGEYRRLYELQIGLHD
jgi:ABC-type multidrug transport system fused ATPase/permease subunit